MGVDLGFIGIESDAKLFFESPGILFSILIEKISDQALHRLELQLELLAPGTFQREHSSTVPLVGGVRHVRFFKKFLEKCVADA